MSESINLAPVNDTRSGLYSLKGTGDKYNINGESDETGASESTDSAEFYDIVGRELSDIGDAEVETNENELQRTTRRAKLGSFAIIAKATSLLRRRNKDKDTLEITPDDTADKEVDNDSTSEASISRLRYRSALALGLPGAFAKKIAAHTVGRLKLFNKENGRFGSLGESGRYNSRLRRHAGETDQEYYDRLKKNGKVTLALGSAAVGSAVTVLTGGAAASAGMLAARFAAKGAVGAGMGVARHKLSGEQKSKKELAKSIAFTTSISMLAGIATAEAMGHGFINRGGESLWRKAGHVIRGWRGEAALELSAQHVDLMSKTVDTQITAGGRGMQQGETMIPINKSLGLHGVNEQYSDYSASIKTPLTPEDAETLNASTDKLAQDIVDKYNASHGSKRIVTYSEATVGAVKALHTIAEQNGGTLPKNLEVVFLAPPFAGNSGIATDPKALMLKDIFKLAGAEDMFETMPKGGNITVKAMSTDFWANSGNKPATTMLSQAIGLAGDGHRAPSADLRHTTRVVDGVTYETYYHNGTQNAALRVAEAHGLKVTEKADKFASALAPTGEVGQDNVRVNAANVIKTGSAAAEEAMVLNGINPQHAAAAKQMIESIPAAPVQQLFDAAQDIPNKIAQGFTQQQAPAWQPPAETLTAPSAPQMPAITPEYVNKGLSQVENFANGAATQAKAAVGSNPQAAAAIDTASKQFNGLLAGLRR